VDEAQERAFLAPMKVARTAPSGEDVPRPARELPPDLLLEASKRLQVLALLLASSLFLANFLGHLLDILVGDIEFFQDFSNWVPGATTILLSLLVYVVVRSHAIAPEKLMDVGLVFGAVSSFGIATTEFWGVYSEVAYRVGDFFGLSWVAVWMLCYTVIIPNRPAKTLLSLIVSASSVSIVIGLSMKYAGTTIPVGPGPFFFGTIFPYLVCTGMAYVGARVVYRLGTAVSRARELGSYRLIDILGSGGMGEVWRAQHRMLARPAAIKLIRPEALGESNSEDRKTVQGRFEREAQATASLRSPHTIELYDFGVSDAGTFYYVMELLDGFDAAVLVERFGPVFAERAVHILLQMCDSLGEAHAAGLVHRDVKPSNVYVCRYGRAVDFVKVLDFGLVKPHDTEGEQLTADHVVSGSPAFMAPEQVLGDKDVDARSDLYAVGCVAYWLLTGQYVFDAANPIQTMVQHAQSTPVPPSKCSELPIPQALDRLVMACLEKDPANRPQSADALVDVLAGIFTDGSWTQERARQWWDQHHPAGGS
jgi:tRNA A-37 threonylcarbamoyl transferase component Bud32